MEIIDLGLSVRAYNAVPGDAFRRHLARIAKECKLSCNTYNKAEELTGVSKSTIIRMEVREDVRLNAVLKLLDAAGYELEIKRKEERQ